MVNETIYEDGNGGQLYSLNNDIAKTEGLQMLAYLKMFGGNINASTVKDNNIGELRLDWWGNDTSENSDKWINSETERTLRGIELSGSSIAKIKQSVENDCKSLSKYGKIDVAVTLPGINKVKIVISITEPGNKESNSLIIIWDATKNEIIEQKII